MDDLRKALSSLDSIEAPDLWPEIERRATAPGPAAQRGTGRFQSMFSATKFVVAGAIVALFGGLLLAGVLTQPSAETAPAAVTDSPEPTAELLPGVELVTEEVEPGVYRVLGDGTDRDMLDVAITPNGQAQVIAGPDGSVWVRYVQLVSADEEPHVYEDRLFRVGHGDGFDPALHGAEPRDVASDGTVWALGPWRDQGAASVFSLTDGAWTAHAMPEGFKATGVSASADGSILASVASRDPQAPGCAGGLGVARLVDGRWLLEEIQPPYSVRGHVGLAVGPDGTMLLGGPKYGWLGCPGPAFLLERTEEGWVQPAFFDTGAAASRESVGPIAVGQDGTVWAWTGGGPDTEPPEGPRLLRRVDGEWELLGDDDSVPQLIDGQSFEGSMTVSSDGRLWMDLEDQPAGDRECAGVISFDGETWSEHLGGVCVIDVSAAPNGNVWAIVPGFDPEGGNHPVEERQHLYADLPRDDVGLYVITPEAVAATE